ncbi:MAG: ABC transporter substrate-binding protein [candidate division KSB1 bacterium]|nr:ABC transporter substrate-binding protein [candidate division KSB1 bacterium]MDZ7410761.1 ABC transporter substrate-binding protein [candidate division KSB1 bacterium]
MMVCLRQTYLARRLVCGLSLLWLLAGAGGMPATAQPGFFAPRAVVVGLLTGEQDVRRLALHTRAGDFLVAETGDASPFSMVAGKTNNLFLTFKPSAFSAPLSQVPSARPPTGVEYRFFTSERSLVSEIILGNIDYAVLTSKASAEEIQNTGSIYQIVPLPPDRNTVDLICYNYAHPLLRDLAVRRALGHAIDRKKFLRQVLSGEADLARGPFEKESIYYTSAVREVKYDPRLAIALLEAAGWGRMNREHIRIRNNRPLRFRLFFQEGVKLKEQLARQIKIDWNQIGIDVIPEPLSAAALNDSVQSGRFDAVLLQHRFADSPASLLEFFGDGSGSGRLGYRSEPYWHTQTLLRNFTRQEDIRTATMRLQLILAEDQPATFLFHPWLVWHIINAAGFADYLNGNGRPKPFFEWRVR